MGHMAINLAKVLGKGAKKLTTRGDQRALHRHDPEATISTPLFNTARPLANSEYSSRVVQDFQITARPASSQGATSQNETPTISYVMYPSNRGDLELHFVAPTNDHDNADIYVVNHTTKMIQIVTSGCAMPPENPEKPFNTSKGTKDEYFAFLVSDRQVKPVSSKNSLISSGTQSFIREMFDKYLKQQRTHFWIRMVFDGVVSIAAISAKIAGSALEAEILEMILMALGIGA